MILFSKHELNILIKNYLTDQGYYHTSFTFTNEVNLKDIQMLYSLDELIQKGMQYLYVESHLKGSNYYPCESSFSLCEKHVCDFKENNYKQENNMDNENSNGFKENNYKKENNTDRTNNSLKKENNNYKKESKMELENKFYDFDVIDNKKNVNTSFNLNNASFEATEGIGTSPRQKDTSVQNSSTNENLYKEKESKIKYNTINLKEHTGDVSICQWNNEILATGSSDSTVRIYKDGRQISQHKFNDEITSLAWKENELAVGNYNGEVFIVNDQQEIKSFKNHTGPVFSMKYHNNSLLTVGYDGKANIDTNKTNIKVHSKAIMDCDWIDDSYILTGSTDFNIGLVNIKSLDVEYLKGHVNEINCVSHKENIIASSSDDSTVILWNIESRKNIIMNGHTKSVYLHKWIGKDLCSIGADGKVIIWDVLKGKIKNTFEHEKSIFGLDYGQRNNLIITGGGDKNLIFWDERIGEVKRINFKGSIYENKFSGSENLLCVCLMDNAPVVLDVRYN